jgi:hypothetical protein
MEEAVMSLRRQALIVFGLAVWLLGPNYAFAAGIYGDYVFRDKNGVHQLTVSKWQQPGAFLFKINVEGEGRWGGISGVANLKGNTASYVDREKECPLTITFQGNKAVVKAPKCRDRLGPLPLEGIYKKK